MKYLTKLEAALELLHENGSCSFNAFNLLKVTAKTIKVVGFTEYIYLKTITKEIALSELERVKSEFYDLLNENQSLATILENKTLEFALAHDSGKSGIGICEEKDGELIWHIPIST